MDLSQFQVRPSIDHLAAISELMGELSLLRAWLTFNRNINYGEAFISVLPDELAEWIGARAAAGRLVPKGFPRTGRFG